MSASIAAPTARVDAMRRELYQYLLETVPYILCRVLIDEAVRSRLYMVVLWCVLMPFIRG